MLIGTLILKMQRNIAVTKYSLFLAV